MNLDLTRTDSLDAIDIAWPETPLQLEQALAIAEEITPEEEPGDVEVAEVPPADIHPPSSLFRLSGHVWLVAVIVIALALQAVNPAPPAWWSRLTSQANHPRPAVAANIGGISGIGTRPLLLQAAPTPDDTLIRAAVPQTIIPERGRKDVITYTVQSGDTLFGIAYEFGLDPETILWSTPDLQGNPHMLSIGQVINILPVDGVYHTVATTDTLELIAETYKVDPNDLYNDWNEPYIGPDGTLVAGANLVVPDGSKEFVVWFIPPPENTGGRPGTGNGTANVGSCGAQTAAIGTGWFVWPTDAHWVSGNPYANWHMGIDLRAVLGANIYAADTGTVVYAGWSTVGYGNLVVIDHGNGWQTWYAHLSQINVNCGDAVWQGNVIGLSGSTGRSTGPHLHFETRWQGSLPNPLDVLPPP